MKSLKLDKPHLIIIVGIPGSGKSFFAKKFSTMFSAPFVNYSFYSNVIANSTACYSVFKDTIDKLLLTEQTFILEGPGRNSDDRKKLQRIAREHGYKILYVWVQTDLTVATKRSVGNKRNQISQQEFTKQVNSFEALNRAENFLVISGKHTYATQARSVLKKLVTGRIPPPPKIPAEDASRKAFVQSKITG